jgi:hypothetical protein
MHVWVYPYFHPTPEPSVNIFSAILHSRTQRFLLRLPILLQLPCNTPIRAPSTRRILARRNRIVNICNSSARDSYPTPKRFTIDRLPTLEPLVHLGCFAPDPPPHLVLDKLGKVPLLVFQM